MFYKLVPFFFNLVCFVYNRIHQVQADISTQKKWRYRRGKRNHYYKVPPRLELGSLDSESRVLTITPWDLSQILQVFIYANLYALRFWSITFKTAVPQNVNQHVMQKSTEVLLYQMSHNLRNRSLLHFLSLRHPKQLLLVGANNRNVIITQRFHAAPVQANRDFFWHTDCIFQL